MAKAHGSSIQYAWQQIDWRQTYPIDAQPGPAPSVSESSERSISGSLETRLAAKHFVAVVAVAPRPYS